MATKKEHRLSVRFDAEMRAWLKRTAKAADRDESGVIRVLVRAAMNREPAPWFGVVTPAAARKAGL